MKHAFRNKLIVISTVYLMISSCFQMIAPVGYRGFVIPYYSVQPYNFTIVRNSDSDATLQVSNIWGQYIDQTNVFVEVREMDSDVQNLQQLSPLTNVIYYDSSFSQVTLLVEGVVVSRNVSDLEQDKWYIWILTPAYDAVGTAATGTYIHNIPSLYASRTSNTTVMYNNAYLDLRAFKTCQWDNNNGCEGGIH